MPVVFFITHPDVAIDPTIPVPDWPLNARGRGRRVMVQFSGYSVALNRGLTL